MESENKATQVFLDSPHQKSMLIFLEESDRLGSNLSLATFKLCEFKSLPTSLSLTFPIDSFLIDEVEIILSILHNYCEDLMK